MQAVAGFWSTKNRPIDLFRQIQAVCINKICYCTNYCLICRFSNLCRKYLVGMMGCPGRFMSSQGSILLTIMLSIFSFHKKHKMPPSFHAKRTCFPAQSPFMTNLSSCLHLQRNCSVLILLFMGHFLTLDNELVVPSHLQCALGRVVWVCFESRNVQFWYYFSIHCY